MLTKSSSISIWVVVVSNHFFVRGFVIGPFCTHYSTCLSIVFWYGSLTWKRCIFNLSSLLKKNGTRNYNFDSHIKTYMPISQMEVYFENLQNIYSFCFKRKSLIKSFSKPNFAAKLAKRSNHAAKLAERSTIHFCCLFDESQFSNICAL